MHTIQIFFSFSNSTVTLNNDLKPKYGTIHRIVIAGKFFMESLFRDIYKPVRLKKVTSHA